MKDLLIYCFLIVILALSGTSCNRQSAAPEGDSVDIIIHHGLIVTLDEAGTVIDNGYVIINQKQIVEIGEEDKWKGKYYSDKVIDAQGSIVMPGLVNTHTHLAMTMFRGMADDLPLQDWLQNHIWPAEGKYVRAETVYAASMLAMVELIRSGTTTFNDMYFFEEEVALAASQIGMRAVVGEGILDFPTPNSRTPEEALDYAIQLHEKWADNPLINVSVAPHSPYTCSEEVLKKCRRVADSLNLPVHIHLSETAGEVEDMRKSKGISPVAYLERIGFLGERTSAAHCVHVSPRDIDILASHQIAVAHNPQSNMKLASGVAPVPRMQEAGLTISLGTDGAASNNDLNMWEEINTAALLHKVIQNDPTVLNAETAVRMATNGGARTLGLETITGSIEPGKHADLIIVAKDEVHSMPAYDIYAMLAYVSDGSDVETVLIDGKLVMENRKILAIDEAEIIAEFRRLTDEIAQNVD